MFLSVPPMCADYPHIPAGCVSVTSSIDTSLDGSFRHDEDGGLLGMDRCADPEQKKKTPWQPGRHESVPRCSRGPVSEATK